MDILVRIKRLVLAGRVRFTAKAQSEIDRDDLTRSEVLESIINAQSIAKTIRARSRFRATAGEKLYVIRSLSYSGTLIYTKGKIGPSAEGPVLYVLISSKVATLGD
ncbi:MAG: hypothetical protein HZB38_00870 [Planctomycetes bacterium]|nr:hypothetical protein [Planctomycetota bacterium]